MIAFATTTVSVLQSVTTNGAGDNMDDNVTVSASGIPYSIIAAPLGSSQFNRHAMQAKHALVQGYDTQEPRDIRFYSGHGPATMNVRIGDRLLDEKTGDVYLVDAVGETRGLVRRTDVRHDLRRVV